MLTHQFSTHVSFESYPNWKVKGVRKDEATLDDTSTERAFYYLLLTDGKTERVIFVVVASRLNE